MKKIVTACLLSLALLLSMTACSNSTGGSSTPAPTPAAATPDTGTAGTPAPADEKGGAPEGYPNGPVTMLVGYTAGGGSDLAIRTFDEFFGPLLGEAVTVSNLPGGGATVAVAELQNSKADGQSIGLVTLSTQSVSPYSLDLPYTIDDFEYLGCFGAYTYALLVPAESPYQSFDDLLEATKSGAVQVSYTSNLHEMLARKIMASTGADFETIYYSSTSDAITDLLGGFIPVALGDIASYSSYVSSGQMRVLASCSDDRWPVAEDVPTLKEMGYDDAAMSSYLGLAVPAGTDPAIVSYLSDLVYQVSSDPTFQNRLFEVTKLQSVAYTGQEIKDIFLQVYEEAAEIYGPIG